MSMMLTPYWFASTTYAFIGDRGVIDGGSTTNAASGGVNTIDYIAIPTPGNATDFGDLSAARGECCGLSGGAIGVFAGGLNVSNASVNVIEYVTTATPGNGTDFGDLSAVRRGLTPGSNGTRGVFIGGNAGSSSSTTGMNVIEYITIASPGNVTDFGDLVRNAYLGAPMYDATRTINQGGRTGVSLHQQTDYITTATTGNSTSFGNATVSRYANGGVTNGTRGVVGAGISNLGPPPTGINTLDYVTIQTTGNSTDFGDWTGANNRVSSGASNATYGIFTGECDGNAANITNVIQYITIASAGNGADFGDLTVARRATGSYGGS